jgi:hypothetical protein
VGRLRIAGWKRVTQARPRMAQARRSAAQRLRVQRRAAANGQQVLRTVKNKEIRFASLGELAQYIVDLIGEQKGRCARTRSRPVWMSCGSWAAVHVAITCDHA